MDFFISRLGISRSKFFEWKKRYGRENLHNGSMPRSFWLEPWEKEAIVKFYNDHPGEGYRRCCYMMIDENIVATSPSTVYRILTEAGAMRCWNGKPSKKGTGFNQPTGPHRHWHVDISYLNICGTFYYMCSVLDGYSRYVVHWEIREKMDENDVQIIVQRAKEKFDGIAPRVISDNGPQFVSRGFKEFIRISGMTHVRTSPHYPQSNGKLERYHGTIKSECIRKKTPLSLEDARRVVGDFVKHYNEVRLHSAIGYVTPADKLQGREKQIFSLRDQRLEQARERRRERYLAGDATGTRDRIGKTGQRETEFSFDRRTGGTAEAASRSSGIRNKCPEGRESAGERVMPEAHLTDSPRGGMNTQ
jgi:transposase InsO family protein